MRTMGVVVTCQLIHRGALSFSHVDIYSTTDLCCIMIATDAGTPRNNNIYFIASSSFSSIPKLIKHYSFAIDRCPSV